MSKADEMFKELGYEKNEDIRTDLGCVYHTRVKHYIYNEFSKIIFHNKFKSISIQKDYISIQELQAINEKVKELRLGEQLNKEIKSIKEK